MCKYFYPKIVGLILNYIFDDFAIGKEKVVTDKIMNSSSEFKKGFIRAFYDDESTVYWKRKTIRVFQDQKEILERIRSILLEFNIKSAIVRSYMKGGKKRHYFNICQRDSLLNFHKSIGFTSLDKDEKLVKLLKDYRRIPIKLD
tara:strand:+ start:132 stop:563 length:432 start_codon:yes stop_codon:yes gene_type:complete